MSISMREMQKVIRDAVEGLSDAIKTETTEPSHRGKTIAAMGTAGGVLQLLASYLDDDDQARGDDETTVNIPNTSLVETPNWFALGEAARARRYELGLAQPDIQRRGGPSTQTIMRIENAHRVRYENRTLTRLEQALGWKPGTVWAILEGRPHKRTGNDDGDD